MQIKKQKLKYDYRRLISLLFMFVFLGIVSTGCVGKKEKDQPQVSDFNNKTQVQTPVDKKTEELDETKMVSYDVTSIGRNDPFAPKAELDAYAQARNSAILEANERNAEVERLRKLKNQSIREADDISPYNFNLPTPPTELASETAAAAKITKTKVVGIMYNKNNPSAILNIDEKDYLVRQGDKIIDQKFKVVQINPNWITVGLGSNIYSASIGELFSKDELNQSTNDLYNLKNRFGGRRG